MPSKPLFYQATRAGRGKRALLHYKTDSLVRPNLAKGYTHTNFWEVLELIRILNLYGFEVDVLDRSHQKFVPEGDVYDLVVSNASGNSGKNFVKFAPLLPSAKKIFYALGPDPEIANALVLDRYKRHTDIPPMRVMDRANINECMKHTDFIFCLDHNGFSTSTYTKFGKPIFRISPSISSKCGFSFNYLSSRKKDHFLCFTGDGFIAKGVDILVEAMEELPRHIQIFIAGPESEPAFFEKYGERIKNLGNIHYVGFVRIGSPKHLKLVRECAYVILPPAAEGLATSLATCMAYGLVPISTYESGVDTQNCGFSCNSDLLHIKDAIQETMLNCSQLSEAEYRQRVVATLATASDFSQASFTHSWCRALSSILGEI